ncbi:unnamed protein product [Anisakis simplex]|uniref:Ovule protein n=1 Tax=Anisakis simplex TaxID=6269 RepID=A0A0M3JDT7_ANISI|nr:unnamed protein product [Anisakis simplex]
MSSNFKQLSSMVCQKLVGLLELFTKRHSKLIEHMRANAEYEVDSGKQLPNYVSFDAFFGFCCFVFGFLF